jgi:putative radical SAM enzyme (TIGR03279 family)
VITIADIERGSIAEELELRIGTRIVRINGEKVRDGIDLTFLLADGELELETVDPDGLRALYEVERDPGEPMGIIPAPDTVRECANECVFCFIDGNPEGVRPSLWIRDDDFRLSFSYGSYVTLTNLGPRGLARLIEQRLSPLYVSVHATEPEVRVRLLKNERAGLILEQLRELLQGGLEVHTQIVLCPDWNDGAHLDRTIDDLWALGEGILSLSVVPVGLTKYNMNRPVRPMTGDESAQAVAQVERARARAREERGFGWAYAADELFLGAGLEVPEEGYYDDGSLMENGVGSVRRFIDDLDAAIEGRAPERLPDLGPGRRIHVLTGRSMAPFIEDRAQALGRAVGGATVEVTAVTNHFYGASVTVAGLLAGGDLLDAVRGRGLGEGDLVLIPGETLNQDDLFIDSLPLADFRREVSPARVVPAWEIPEALRLAATEAA